MFTVFLLMNLACILLSRCYLPVMLHTCTPPYILVDARSIFALHHVQCCCAGKVPMSEAISHGRFPTTTSGPWATPVGSVCTTWTTRTTAADTPSYPLCGGEDFFTARSDGDRECAVCTAITGGIEWAQCNYCIDFNRNMLVGHAVSKASSSQCYSSVQFEIANEIPSGRLVRRTVLAMCICVSVDDGGYYGGTQSTLSPSTCLIHYFTHSRHISPLWD